MSGSGSLPPAGRGPSRTFAAPAGFRDSPEPSLAPGEVVASQYSVRRELVRQDSGALFEAWDMILERTVLLKVAWRDPGAPPLLLEARRCAGIACEAGAAIHTVGNHRGLEFIAAERLVVTTVREHLASYASAGARLGTDDLLQVFTRVSRALEAVHSAGFTVGDLAPETIALVGPRRIVFGRFALGQVAAVGPTGLCLAPEVVLGRATPTEPTAAIAIDLYGLGCLGLELALGRPPFAAGSTQELLAAHARVPAPSAAEGRPDIPAELTDLLAELCAKEPDGRGASAAAVVAQLDVIAERAAAARRAIRILVVDDDGDRVRAIWSAARRANARVQVDAARDGREAAGKITRDRPDLVLIDAGLGAAVAGMNALELVMFTRGLEDTATTSLVIVGPVTARDVPMVAQFGARVVERNAPIADLITAVANTPRLGSARRTING